MVWSRNFVFFLACWAVCAVHAQVLMRSMEGVSEYRLKNGLQVLLAPNDLQPRNYVNLVVKAGSAVEGFGEGGMAHLLEHMIFKGSPSTRDPMKAFADRSLQFNGTTNQDRTNYFASMNPDPENLHWYLGWLADAATNSFIAKADLDKEMTVVRNEFERGGASPERAMYQARMALAFPTHGYGRPTIGNRADIENVNIERLQLFYKTWYRPDNMVLVVTGRFDANATLAHIQSVFGVLKNPNTPLAVMYTREPAQDGVREALIRRVGTETGVLIGWRGVPRAHRDDVALDVVASALTHEGSGRFKTDIEKKGLGTRVSAGHHAMRHDGLFDVALRVNDPSQRDAVQALLLDHVAAIAQSGVTTEELKRAQAALLADAVDSKQTAENFGAQLAENAAAGDWRLLFWAQDHVRTVTVADTQRVAQNYLVDANRVRVTFLPEAKPVRANHPQPQDLGSYVAQTVVSNAASPLPPLAAFEPTLQQIEKNTVRTQLKGGTHIALLPRPAVGEAMVGTLRIHWGQLDTMRGQGAAPFVGSLLLKGTQSRNEAQLNDELNQLQSNLSIHSNVHGLAVNFKTTRQHWPAFSRLLQDTLRRPAFDPVSFKTWQNETVASIVKQLDSPEAKASNALSRAMQPPYDSQDPRYVPSLEENLARWQALSLEDVKRFWAQFSGASVAEFAAAGALDVAQVQQDVAQMLDDWQTPGGPASFVRIPRPLFLHPAKNLALATPDKPNALLYAAHSLSADPWSREGIAMRVANGIFGGSSSSRLFTRLRKDNGLSYGVGSYLNANEDDQTLTFGLYGSFAPDNKSKFESTLREVIDDVVSNGLSSVELFFAKRMAADLVKRGLNSDAYMAGEIAHAEFKGRMGAPRDAAWYEEKQRILQSLTIEEVDAAAKKLLLQSRLVRVTAGDFK